MALDVHIVEPMTGKIDPELEAHLEAEAHEVLFSRPELRSDGFPLLGRMVDYYANASYAPGELEALIAELECVGGLFEPGSAVSLFLGRFHSVCCLAFFRQKNVFLFAD